MKKALFLLSIVVLSFVATSCAQSDDFSDVNDNVELKSGEYTEGSGEDEKNPPCHC